MYEKRVQNSKGAQEKHKMNDNGNMMAMVITNNDFERFIESEGRRNVARVEAQNRKRS